MRITPIASPDTLYNEDPVLSDVAQALAAGGHETTEPVSTDTPGALLRGLRRLKPELVFNLSEQMGAGEDSTIGDAHVAALLEAAGLTYSGNGPQALFAAGDKSTAKKILAFHSIRSPDFATIYRGKVDWAHDLEFPLLVKAARQESSIGISTSSVVKNVKELLERIEYIHETFEQPALVEQYIEGREFYLGIVATGPEARDLRTLPPIELVFDGFPDELPKVASWEAKWEDEHPEYKGSRVRFPKDLPEEVAARVAEVARAAFDALGCRDYGRVDLRVNETGEIYVLEVNPNCYLAKESEFARAAKRDGIAYDDLILGLARAAAARRIERIERRIRRRAHEVAAKVVGAKETARKEPRPEKGERSKRKEDPEEKKEAR